MVHERGRRKCHGIDENRIEQDFSPMHGYQDFQYQEFDEDGEEKRGENRNRCHHFLYLRISIAAITHTARSGRRKY